jgi:hypothetical protein
MARRWTMLLGCLPANLARCHKQRSAHTVNRVAVEEKENQSAQPKEHKKPNIEKIMYEALPELPSSPRDPC